MPNYKLLLPLILTFWSFCLLWLLAFIFYPVQTTWRASFLDVGQGDSTLLALTANHRTARILIDTGRSGASTRELKNILPLWSEYLDLITLSHREQDHSGGLGNILNSFSAGLLISNGQLPTSSQFNNFLNQAISSANLPTLTLLAGDSITYGPYIIKVLNPITKPQGTLNENSLVLLVKTPEASFLFTGDIGASTEQYLTNLYDLSQIDILKVPHHGSRFSSSREFLSELSPTISVIQVGHNSYGHPTKEALDRLASVNSLVFRNDESGTIQIYPNGNKLKITSLK